MQAKYLHFMSHSYNTLRRKQGNPSIFCSPGDFLLQNLTLCFTTVKPINNQAFHQRNGIRFYLRNNIFTFGFSYRKVKL